MNDFPHKIQGISSILSSICDTSILHISQKHPYAAHAYIILLKISVPHTMNYERFLPILMKKAYDSIKYCQSWK